MDIKELKKKTIGFISLGCGKNVVELEKMISQIQSFGMKIVTNENDANIMLINSCAFLKATRKEGFDIIKELQHLRENKLEKVILTGCLPGYKLDDISKNLEGVDLILTQDRNCDILKEIANLYGCKVNCKYNGYSRVLTTPSHYAYLRVADGCNAFCSYCTIPYIVGRYKSVDMKTLISEAQELADKGVKELIFVAQDITTYGIDFDGKSHLVELIREISKINRIEKIRLIYCYPEHLTDELIEEIKNNKKVCKYIDIPLQHISNHILLKMNRKNTLENTIKLINKLRKNIPEIKIRSTFILGFPGETEQDIEALIKFLKEYKLYQVGFFAYSREKGTIAYALKPQISEKVKKERVKKLFDVQYKIVVENNKQLIGKEFEAVVDCVDNYSILRTDFQLPDLDNVTIVENSDLQVGERVKVKIIGVNGYDLIAEVVD